jgi:predicted protein tyrosine phosphatase
MSAIYVCPLSRLADTVTQSGARHIVTLINNDTLVTRPPHIDRANHLHLGIHDICEPAEGMICPAEEHIEELIAFARRWDREAAIVIHCYAGISRSTAAAFSAFCAVRPDLEEAVIAGRLRRGSPEATPNARIVAIADALLGRGGRMTGAIAGIGRGIDAAEGSVFALRLDE